MSDIRFGTETLWRDGLLQINRDEVVDVIKQDPLVAAADVQLARPGESVRIITISDVIEPRVKVKGDGVAFPGVYGRSPATVGCGRTNRLGGMGLVSCATYRDRRNRLSGVAYGDFVDMSGPGADTPYSNLCDVCLVIEPSSDLNREHYNRVIQRAMLRVSDLLAKTTIGQEPVETETFDMTAKQGLPGYVYAHSIVSPEGGSRNPDSTAGTAIYGITRLTQPWLLKPTEILDGAAFGAAHGAGCPWMTWPLMNTLVLHMCRRHGKDFNFLGCIMVRTMWEEQWQKELVANRTALMANMLGADGALVTPTLRGQRFVETIMVVQALERTGVKTVLITEEEDDEDGTAPPLLVAVPEVVSVVSTGTGGAPGPFPPVEKVIGVGEIDSRWHEEQDPPHGQYGTSHLGDVWGFGRQGCVDY